MNNLCPKCQKELHWNNGTYYCESCQQHHVKNAFCNNCSSPLEKLKACGAVQYFCNHCNELKSKSVVLFKFDTIDKT